MNAVLKHEPPIRLLATGIHVAPLIAQLEKQPELWNENTFRTQGAYGNPHSKLSDIILRYRDWSEWTGDRRAFVDPPFRSVWWQPAECLPYAMELVHDLARMYCADEIGAVFVTKIPPHTRCEPHRDIGWAANYFRKFALQLKAHPQQRFCFEDAQLVTEAGDLFEFCNQELHWVSNDSPEERVTLIMTLHIPSYVCRNYQWRAA